MSATSADSRPVIKQTLVILAAVIGMMLSFLQTTGRLNTSLRNISGISTIRRSVLKASAKTMHRSPGAVDPRAAAVLEYWFGSAWNTGDLLEYQSDSIWFKGSAADKEISDLFKKDIEDVAAGKHDHWIESPKEALAGIIIMDQLSRNVYRNSAQMYALDDKAIAWSKHLVDTKQVETLPYAQRVFVFMPFMHSEVLSDQEQCVALFKDLVDKVAAAAEAGNAQAPPAFLGTVQMYPNFAERHRVIVAKWGRFPHRNSILGRSSTAEEEEGLKDGTIERF